MKNTKRIVIIMGIILIAAQLLAIVGNARFDNNPWNSSTFLTGSLYQIILDIVGLLGYFLMGIIGTILIVIGITHGWKSKTAIVDSNCIGVDAGLENRNRDRDQFQQANICKVTPVKAQNRINGGSDGAKAPARSVLAISIVAFCIAVATCAAFAIVTLQSERKIAQLSDEIVQQNSEIDSLQRVVDKQWDMIYELKNENPIAKINAVVDKIRNPQELTFKEFTTSYIYLKSIIADMFLEASKEDITEYMTDHYKSMYPIRYFRDILGYTYTGDVIEGWAP